MHGLQKCSETFEKDMASFNCFDTTTIAISSIKGSFDDITKNLQEKVNMVFGDLIEPMELYSKHYIATSQEQVNSARAQWQKLIEEKTKIEVSKEKYYKHM